MLVVLGLCVCLGALGCVERRTYPQRQEREHLATSGKFPDGQPGERETPRESTLTYFVVLVTKGETWSPDPTPDVIAIQRRHEAFLDSLRAGGILLADGPFVRSDTTDPPVAMFILRGESEAEVSTLMAGDPSVVSGRYAVEVFPWIGPASLTNR